MVFPHNRSNQRRPRMKLHRNAKSTPSSRLLLVRRVLLEGWSYAAAADGFAVSVRTVAKWVRRFKDGGIAALEDASSRPGAPPHQTSPGAVALIRILREQHGLPAWAIGRALRMPRSTVSGWLRRLGLNRLPTAPPIPVQRYEWPCPGDLLHVDIKPLGRIGQVGHRIQGLATVNTPVGIALKVDERRETSMPGCANRMSTATLGPAFTPRATSPTPSCPQSLWHQRTARR